MELSLRRVGYDVTTVETSKDARSRIEDAGADHFGCLITDEHMSDGTGLDLLLWLRERDPSLATIVIAAESEQKLVEETMRAGACDFLNKPFASDRLQSYVGRAIGVTEKRRQLASMATAVEEVGRIQSWMVRSGASAGPLDVELVSFPKHEAGGDFFSCYPVSDNCTAALMTDVSGHDLKAAYIAAYMQGIVRAMLETGSSLNRVFERCNEILIEEWGVRADSVPSSVAANSLLIDLRSGVFHVSTCGAPLPLFTNQDGRSELLGAGTSYPLGWFPAFETDSVTRPLQPGHIIFWTDGVTGLAEQLGVSPLAVASALMLSRKRACSCPWMSGAEDDVMSSRLSLHGNANVLGAEGFYPILSEFYEPEHVSNIDEMQASWTRNLLLVMPELSGSTLHDALLCSREMVLNAIRHGCKPGEKASLQMALQPSSDVIRILVDDPGPGHDFQVDEHENSPSGELPDAHFGLIMVRHLTSRFTRARNGASVTMDFKRK